MKLEVPQEEKMPEKGVRMDSAGLSVESFRESPKHVVQNKDEALLFAHEKGFPIYITVLDYSKKKSGVMEIADSEEDIKRYFERNKGKEVFLQTLQ